MAEIERVTVFLPSINKPQITCIAVMRRHMLIYFFFTVLFFLDAVVQFTVFLGGLTCQLDVIDSNRRVVAVNVKFSSGP